LLVLGLEDPHHLPRGAPREVAPRTPLRYHPRMHPLVDSRPHILQHLVELPLRHPRAEVAQLGRGDGPDALRGAEHRVVDLEALLLLAGAAALAALEL